MPMTPMTLWCGIAQGRGVQRGRDDLAGGAARVQAGVAGHPPLHDFSERRRELALLLRADKAGQRLLDQLVRAESEQLRCRVVRLEDLALKIRHEYRVRCIGDDDRGI